MKKVTIEWILKNPKKVKREEIDKLIWSDNKGNLITRDELKCMFLRVYDLNNSAELGQAHHGLMGWLNRINNNKRNKTFFNRLRKNIESKKIYAEGDSWFQHPLIKDLIDQIDAVSGKKFAIYSSAMGGEWWINIIEDGDYLPEISKIKPQIILLSGAGNDLVGGKKLSNLVNVNNGYLKEDFGNLSIENFDEEIRAHTYLGRIMDTSTTNLTDEQKEYLIYGIKVLSKEFYSLLWTFELMYKYVLRNIQIKHDGAKIITQGYDYPIPSYKKGPGLKKFFINWGMNNGHWLADALNLAGIQEENQKKVTFSLIHIFNEVLISITKDAHFKGNLYHIDARNATNGDINNWYDEMHVKSHIFKNIANTYVNCISDNNSTGKVYKV